MEDWRYHVAVEPITLTDDDTEQIDLPSEGVISKMEILLNVTNLATIENFGQRRLAEHITNVEIRGDTVDIIHDLNAFQSRMFACDTEQMIPPEMFRGYNGAEQYTVIPVYFGRYARDHDYGLDLSKWTNVRLSLTNDSLHDRFVEDDITASVRLLWTFDDEIKPPAYLAKSVIDEQSVTTAGMWARPVIMPVRYPIRRIGVEANIPTITTADEHGKPKADLIDAITELKFYKQARKDLIWDDTLEQLFRFNEDEYGHHLIECYLDMASEVTTDIGLYTDTMLGRLENVVNQDYHTEALIATAVPKVSDFDFERNHHLWAWGTADAQSLVAHGRGYNTTGLFRFYTYTPREIHGDHEENWLHPGPGRDGVCEIMARIGDTDVDSRILVEQAIPHPTD